MNILALPLGTAIVMGKFAQAALFCVRCPKSSLGRHTDFSTMACSSNSSIVLNAGGCIYKSVKSWKFQTHLRSEDAEYKVGYDTYIS